MNPAGALEFAQKLAAAPDVSLDFGSGTDVFMQHNCLQQATSFLLDVLKGNKPEEAGLQTRLLEMNLMAAPQVADAIMANDMFTHYDRPRIAMLCEKAGLVQRAMERYENVDDIKRAMSRTELLNPEQLVKFFGTMSVENSLECLHHLLRTNMRQNLQLVVQVAREYTEQLSTEKLIEMFEQYNSWEGLFYYLGAVLLKTEDKAVHFKYIQAASKVGNLQEVERVTREDNCFDPEEVKNFLKEARLPDQRPLINVCDRYDMVEDLTHFLYSNNMSKYIELYVQKVNPMKAPQVAGALLDSDCSEDFVRALILSVRAMAPAESLVEEVEKRNRLKIIQPWLEQRQNEGVQEAAVHNALMKIYIDMNNRPEEYLTTNIYYDSKVVGEYCEKRDPLLSFLAYKRGMCDDELVDVTNRHGLFKQQARYLVERQDLDLWAKVLTEENEHRRPCIDSVVQNALPETKNPDVVSTTVKAFMTADLPNELIELLEKIVLQSGSEFSENKNLQNLLILTAIKADKTRVMDYINRLDNYDMPDIANIAVGSELYEEALVIFKKAELHREAAKVLIDYISSIERATEFAERIDEEEVWVMLGKAQLHQQLVKEAMQSFIKANDATEYVAVIAAAESQGANTELVTYLNMCRKKVKEAHIDTSLIFAYAKSEMYAELEEFISAPNVGRIQDVAERCYAETMYEAAKILFNSISNFSRLATCLMHLGEHQAAVDAARKANSTRTWKEVNASCVEHKEFRLAQICALHIIVNPDELEELIGSYEKYGHFDEVISVMEAGLGLERAHMGIFTELGVLYSKYRDTKLMEHLKLFWSRLNIRKMLKACEEGAQWEELTFLYLHYDEFDNAVLSMIAHPVAFEHVKFKDTVGKVTNTEIFYKAIDFYLAQQPLMLNDLLSIMSQRVDHVRVIQQLRKAGHVALAKPYLLATQTLNIKEVNDALYELYVQDEDHEALAAAVVEFTNFDAIEMAQLCEKHGLLQFRRIGAMLYKRSKKWAQSIALSKLDKVWDEAISTAAESSDPALAEELLAFFVGESSDSALAED